MSTEHSFQRTTTLVASIVVALSAGTNYVYSAYAPQLGQKIGLNHAQLNVIGFGGNAGNYLAGPFWGKAVDARGPRPLLLSSFACLLMGYFALRMFYDGTISLSTDPSTTLTPAVIALTFWELVTGVGSNAGITASLNSTAKSFPDSSRATVTGLVISGFGLSAFLFSSIAHLFFPGNTSDFLLLLALGTSLPPLIGLFFIRIVPHAIYPDDTNPITAGGADAAVEVFSPVIGRNAYDRLDDHPETAEDEDLREEMRRTPSSPNMRKPLLDRLSRSFSRSSCDSWRNSHQVAESSANEGYGGNEVEELREARSGLLSGKMKSVNVMVTHPDVHGWPLLKSADFWLIFSILALLAGTGLMYINNVGSITQALYIKDNGSWDEHAGSKVQAKQVSITSLGNCFGRAIIGVSADFVHGRTGAPRVYLVTVVSIIFLMSQLIAMGVSDVADLWKSSASVGLAYGGTFGLLPVITIEWFGLSHFSQNWGFVSMAPVIASNIFSLAFGKNYDAHASQPAPPSTSASSHPLSSRGGLPSELLCYQGRECYIDSLRITIVACFVAILLSIYAGVLDHRKQKARRIAVNVLEEPESE